MNLYLAPTSELGLQNRIFQGKDPEDFWAKFYKTAVDKRINLNTIDRRITDNSDDVLLVQNHHEVKGRFRKRILLQLESPVMTPKIYRNLASIMRRYDVTYSLPRFPNTIYFNYFNFVDNEPLPPVPKTKFMVMINSNIWPHTLKNELISKRLEAIKFFSDFEGFDLYGRGWDSFPKHPLYLHYGKYVKKVWRGEIPSGRENKLKVLQQYQQAICFENCRWPGYVTEKAYDCNKASVKGIWYYGAPDIEKVLTMPKRSMESFIDEILR